MLSAANLTGMLGISVPCGFASGQPIGLHIMGRVHSDATLLAIALAYQSASQWSRRVPVRVLPEAR
jgi:aspartyl-tRNA(Asn)/glutamyl-tRNA(Gln) amidotransferase subunit A